MPRPSGPAYLAAEADDYQLAVTAFSAKLLDGAPLTREWYLTVLHSKEHDNAIEQLTDARQRAEEAAMASWQPALEASAPGKWAA